MCTGFVKKGGDLIFGFNFDLAEGTWDYKVYARKDVFFIGIKVGGTVYRTHGVNSGGAFGVLPYMNAPDKGVFRRGRNVMRIDLIVDRYIAGRYSFGDVAGFAASSEIVSVPSASLHSLVANGEGRMLLIEPGIGSREISGDHALIANFPVIDPPADLSHAMYGKDRFDTAERLLQSPGGFSADDGMALLQSASQRGEWATRVSFVYSKNENAVYFVRNNDFSNITKHSFAM